ncbi:MAG: outer rane lipoprotein chaperone LolA [Pseudomonadota bacterium]|jgi:outer membrane lipoprotein carrier protein
MRPQDVLRRNFIARAVPGAMLALGAWAPARATGDVVLVEAGPQAALVDYLAGTFTLAAQFEHLQSGRGGRVQTFKGEMLLKRPGRFRWEIQSPYAQLQIIRDKIFLLYDPDLAQLTKRPIESALDATPAGLLLSAGPEAAQTLARQFEMRALPSQSGLQRVLLTPRSANASAGSSASSLEVGLNDKGEITQFELTDGLGRRSLVRLKSIRRNQPIADSRFEFTPPAGTEVIQP